MIHVEVSNKIIITGLPKEMKNALKQSLTIPNKEFEKFKHMNIWSPREFVYWKEPKGFTDSQGALEIPRGCLTRLLAYLPKSDVVYNLVDKPAQMGISSLVLRDYQEPIVAKIVGLKPSEGILVSSTGSGKTAMALEIACRLRLTTTILVINTVLLQQFSEEAEKFYGVKAAIIDARRKEIGPLTIATFQSLFDAPKLLQELVDNTSLLILDEVQGIVSKERAKVLAAFRPKHILGLTATPLRTDSLTPAIFFLSGHPIAEHQMEQCQPEIEVIRTGAAIPMSDTYNDIIVAMVENESRNKLLAGLVLGEALEGRKCLVLTKRINHYELLHNNFFPEYPGFLFIDSSDRSRNSLLGRLKRGEQGFSVLFGTTSLLAVGTDVPSLDTLIIACDMKSSVLTTQSVGRVLRLFEGKPVPRIIDLYDDGNPILAAQFKSRLELYKAKGWEISHYFKCRKCSKAFTYYRKEYLKHNRECYGKPN